MSEEVKEMRDGSFLCVNEEGKAYWGQPKGYPYKAIEKTALVENMSVTPGYHTPAEYEVNFAFAEGQTYAVEWNGETYECVAFFMEGIAAIGNLVLLGAGDDTGEPFIMYASNGILYIKGTDSSTAVTLSIYGQAETIHPMAPEFLPAGGGASSADVFIIHATTDETFTNVQLDKTAEQIYEAYQSRKYCLVDFNGTFFPVTSVETNGSKYLMSGNGFAFPTSEQGSAAGFELATSDGVTWSVKRITPYLYNVRFNGLQISGPGNQYYTISVDTNGNLTATVVT